MNLSFLSPQFLYLLPALGIPLILHLISRNKSVDLIFSTIRFLKIGQVPKQQKRRVKDIILLIVRTLLIALLILILAQPQIAFNNLDNDNSQRQVLIIDAGLIRFHADYFSELKISLDKLKTEVGPTNLKTYIVSASQSESYTNLDVNSIIDKIKALKPDYKEPNFAQTFKNAQNFLTTKESKLFFVTNLRRKNFQTMPLKSFSNNVNAKLINIPLSNANIGIVDVQVMPVEEFKKFRITCTVINETGQDQNINLSLKGYNEENKKIVTAIKNQPSRFLFEINASENHDFYLQHDFKDSYALDNIRYFRTPDKQVIKGLLIYDQKDYSSDKPFIEEVLKLNNEFLTPIELKQIEASSSDWSTLEQPQFIFILGCAAKLDVDKIKKIKELLLQGSILFNTPGENFKENLNILNSNGLILQSSGPLIKSEYQSEPFFIESYNTESGLLKIFDNDPKPLFSISIKKYIKLFTHGAAETLLATNNRTPLLALNRVGKGLSYIFSINFNLDWSALPVSTVFVPLIRELIQNSIVSIDNKPNEIESGDFILSKESRLNYFNQENTQTISISENKENTLTSPGIYKSNEQSWVANTQSLKLDGNTISEYEFQEKLIDKSKVGLLSSENEPFDPSRYFAMLLLIFFVSELVFMKTIISNKVQVK